MSTAAREPRNKELAPARRALLEKRLQERLSQSYRLPSIPRRRENGPAPLSYAQQRLWFIHQLEPGNPAYNEPMAVSLQGKLRVDLLEQALGELLRRHEVLRATFPNVDGSPAQVIEPAATVRLDVVDLSSLPEKRRMEECRQQSQERAMQPFDLKHGPVVRFTLFRIDERHHQLLVVMHHIVCDGWSTGIIVRDLKAFYTGLLRGEAPELADLPIQYPDYAEWQQATFQGDVSHEEISFWRTKLAGAPDNIALPTDFSAPTDGDFRGAEVGCLLDQQFREKLDEFCRTMRVTPFMVLVSILCLSLHRWTRQSELVIGTVVAGRTRREVENLVGCFMNFLPLRLRIKPEATALNFLGEVKQTVLEATTHQQCPFEKIVEAVNPARRLNQNPLYNVAVLLQNWPETGWADENLRTQLVPVTLPVALLDLQLVTEPKPEGLWLNCKYDVNLFREETIQVFVRTFARALELVIAKPETKVADFDCFAELERQVSRSPDKAEEEVLAITATFTAEPIEEPITFWAKELALPLRTEFAPYNQVFQQLLDPSSLLSSNARGLNVVLLRVEDWLAKADEGNEGGQKELAGGMERTATEFLEGLRAAVGRVGTPWLVCLCPESPGLRASPRHAVCEGATQRLQRELEALKSVQLVTAEELFRLYPVDKWADPESDRLGHVPYTPEMFAALGTMVVRKLHALKRPPKKVIALDCDQTLWGGICGEDGPAGIVLDESRLALQRFMREQAQAGMLLCICSKNNEEDVWEVFRGRPEMPLRKQDFAAWRINWQSKAENLRVLASELGVGLDSFIFVDDNPMECAEVGGGCEGVLTLQLPEDPAVMSQFLQHVWAFDHLKVTEEDRNRTLAYQQNRARAQFQARSMSFSDFLAGLELQIDIGPMRADQLTRAAQLTQRTNQFNCTTRRRTEPELEMLTRDTRQVLCVSVKDRFGDYGQVGVVVLEVTGDALSIETFLLSCRVLGKGVEHRILAYLGSMAQERRLGRVDVWFRASPKNQPALRFLESAGAAFRQTTPEGSVFRFPADYAKRLVFQPAQVETAGEEAPVPSLGQASGFVVDASFPRCRWIALEAANPESIVRLVESNRRKAGPPARQHLPPRNDTEKQLCAIWTNLLRLPEVGVSDDFFESGGTSLLAVRLFAEIEKITGKALPLVTLFKAPTIEKLAKFLEEKKSRRVSSSLVAIQSKGSKPPLVLVHGAGGGLLWGYANLAMKLGPDQPVYAFEPPMPGSNQGMRVDDMATRYVEELRSLQAKGPYYLGGYCFGGYIAYEMARLLQTTGETVALLAVIDGAAPNGTYERVTWWHPLFAFRFARNCWYWLEDFRKLKPEEQRNFVTRKTRVALRKLLDRMPWRRTPASSKLDLEEYIDTAQFPEDELKLWQMHLRAGSDYRPKPYPGKLTLLRTRGQPLFCSFDPEYGWGELAQQGVRVKRIRGSHENIFLDPDLASLAKTLQNCLEEAQREHQSKTNLCA